MSLDRIQFLIDKAKDLKTAWLETKCTKLESCMDLHHFMASNHLSERQAATFFEISKSEIHRMVLVARLPTQIKVIATNHQCDFHTLVVLGEAVKYKDVLAALLLDIEKGKIKCHKDARKQMTKFRKLLNLRNRKLE